MAAKFRVKQDNAGQWYWMLYDPSGESVACSSESYPTRNQCLHSIKFVKEECEAANVFDFTKGQVEIIERLP